MKRVIGPCAIACAALSLLHVAAASEVRVCGGSFRLEGTLRASTLQVRTNATLFGNGALDGNLVVGGTVDPGSGTSTGVGTQTVSGLAMFLPGSRFICYCASHTSIDRLNVTGTVVGACLTQMTNAPGAWPIDAIVVKGGALSDYSGFLVSNALFWRLGESGSRDLVVTHLRGDTDGDDMPDWWESWRFGSRTAGNAAVDSDSDGASNGAEYHANTDPLDTDSVLRIVSIARSASTNTVIAWTTSDGRRYYVRSQTNLLDGIVVTAAVVNAYTQPVAVWTNESDNASCKFYSIRVEEAVP